MNILVIGRKGQLAWELQRTLAPLGQVIAMGYPEIDLASPKSIQSAIRNTAPDLIVNSAAYTAVDQAEFDEYAAMQINAVGSGIVADEAKRLKAALVTYSTDYVFDGSKTCAYTEEDTPFPLSVYGHSKLAGDQAVQAVADSYLIFRTSWVYGARGKNFLASFLERSKQRSEMRIVDDQVGSPTWSRAIAEVTAQVLAQVSVGAQRERRSFTEALSEYSGLYNLSSGGSVSWFGFAQEILAYEADERPSCHAALIRISTAEYGAAARRPANSLLSNAKLMRTFNLRLPQWQSSLALVMQELNFVRRREQTLESEGGNGRAEAA